MTPQSVPATITIRKIRLTNLAMDDVLDALHAAVVKKVATRVAFVNADCVNIAARDPGYLADLQAMDWVFADGIGVKLAGQLLQQPVRANVNGTDLFPLLCEDMAREEMARKIFSATTPDLQLLQKPACWRRSRRSRTSRRSRSAAPDARGPRASPPAPSPRWISSTKGWGML